MLKLYGSPYVPNNFRNFGERAVWGRPPKLGCARYSIYYSFWAFRRRLIMLQMIGGCGAGWP